MDVAIIGAGAIGLLCASYINQNHTVTLYTRSKETADALALSGIINDTYHQRTYPPVLPIDAYKHHEVTLVAVKSYHIASLVPVLKQQSGLFVFMQNGMSHLEVIQTHFIHSRNWVGAVTHGAKTLATDTVSHTGIGQITLAPLQKNFGWQADGRKLRECLSALHPVVSEDAYPILHNKLMINAVVNPLTAYYEVTNGELLTEPYHDSVKRLLTRVCHILNLDKEAAYNTLKRVIQLTKSNRSSMLADLLNQRPTENEAILGYLLSIQHDPLVAYYYQSIKKREDDYT